MATVELSAGTIEYDDSGGDGPVVVLLHGLAMDGSLWDAVVADLRADARCIRPTLPFGSHRYPLHADADHTLRGLGRLVTEFLDALGLDDAALVFDDWCAAPLMIEDGGMDRVGRLVILPCEAFENYPPGWPGRLAALSGWLPGGIAVMRRVLLNRTLRKLPFVYGVMSKRGVPDATMRAWLEPLKRREIRRDVRAYVRTTRGGRRDLLAATESLANFERPVLIVWGSEDRMMPVAHAHRFATAFPHARVIELDDTYTLVPIDQPAPLTALLREFVLEEASAAS
ncbi:MAG TPA: alpha/beta hydrolase [Acidimicrobiia bacterium]|jgi:pimeloyl-ACP methyl ester carboxylesterase|nr:alpha/beta hydrolase [Acidimicrobiia bacterium]